MKARLLSMASSMLILAACSSDDKDSSGGAATTTDGGGSTPLADGSTAGVAGDLVVNEFVAAGSAEWIELVNKGASEIDIGGFAITDTDKDTGGPKLDSAMKFPAGTKVAAGARVLVLTSKKDSTPGPYAAAQCLPGVALGCFYADFGVSAKTGEAVHILDASSAAVSSAVYPAGVAVDATMGHSACRLPDGTGAFAECTATPAAVNAAP